MPDRPRILMCPPAYFSVEYVINPWMQGHIHSTDPVRARAQWDALRKILEETAQIEIVDPGPGLPDMPFTANAGLMMGDVFVPSRFRHAQRQGEEALFTHWFRQHGYVIREIPETLDFEGAGDALLDGAAPRLWLGHGHRSNAEVGRILAAMFDIETVALRLHDPRFYHLDTCFCPLSGGGLLYYPPAFDDAAQADIAERVPQHRRIVASEDDALAFACNAVNVGERVVLNRASDALKQALRSAGYQAVETPMDEFLKAGGSAKCLTLRLDEA